MSKYILEMNNVQKSFGSVKALKNVTIKAKQGDVLALCGENGAGKSTIMKVLSGVYSKDEFEGEILLNGERCEFNNIRESENKGITIIYQELSLVKQLNIMDNVLLGSEITKKGVIDWEESFVLVKQYLEEVELNLSPLTLVSNLGVGQQQLVEIAKALVKKPKILILDEPTAALTESESQNLLKIIRKLKSKGVTCIYISHKLEEVLQIADTVTVIRDGESISTNDTSELDKEKIVSLMVGRELSEMYPTRDKNIGDIIFEVKDLNVKHPEIKNKNILNNINLSLRKGEVLGISGLMGAGRTELAMSIFGAYEVSHNGQIYLDGEKLNIKHPKDAIDKGIAYVSEDRKRYGLVLDMDIKTNMPLASLGAFQKGMSINENELIKSCNNYFDKMKVKAESMEQKCQNLSGGNQQKVILAKWLMTKPKVLILDEPTRGIDVGAKYEIYSAINKIIEEGVSVIMISSDLPEVLGMSDRILVMRDGEVAGELDIEVANQENTMFYATGGY